MASYLEPVPNIPSLSPTSSFQEDNEPLLDKLSRNYTDTANVVNDKARRQIYLTQEDITNDSWVDNKAIFRKTVDIPALAVGVNNVAHGITNLETIVSFRAIVSNGTNQRPLPYASPTAANSASVDVTTTNIVIECGASFGANFNGYAHLEYTKV